jgi:hypothetical protein
MTNRLVQFTLYIRVRGRQREFNFRQRDENHYDGNTTDERGDRYYFKLVKANDKWAFGDITLPAWLRETETDVVNAIDNANNNLQGSAV